MNQEVQTLGGHPARPELDLWNPDNARSVFCLVPSQVRNAMLAARAATPDLFSMEERELRRHLRDNKIYPSPTDNRLRMKFWSEYEATQDHLAPNMSMAAVSAGICSREYFLVHYLARPEKVAWMLCPPANYNVMMEEALLFGIEQMRDILAMDNELPNGLPNTKLMELKTKIIAMLDIRVKGAIVQKVEQKTMQLNLHSTGKGAEAIAQLTSMEDLEKKMRELEKRERRALNLPEPASDKPVIEVKSE